MAPPSLFPSNLHLERLVEYKRGENIFDFLLHKAAPKRFVENMYMQAADYRLINGPDTRLKLLSLLFGSRLSRELPVITAKSLLCDSSGSSYSITSPEQLLIYSFSWLFCPCILSNMMYEFVR